MDNKIIRIYFSIIALFISFGIFMVGGFVSASSTDGTIDSTYKYAWTENTGWLNFGTSEGNVHVSDSALTGYIWSENLGWISLNCANDDSCAISNYKIANDGSGNLSGYAWNENTGWINFNPTNGGVSINSSGDFSGYAWNENTGWIIFNCATTNSCSSVSYKVETDWRPRSARPECNNAIDDDNDGNIDYPADIGCSSLEGDKESNHPGGVPMYILSPTPAGEKAVEISPETSPGQTEPAKAEEEKKVSELLKPIIETPIKEIKKTFNKVIGLFKPKPEATTEPKEKIKELIPKEAPPVMKGEWALLPSESVDGFALTPLPKELSLLLGKFPELEKTFARLGINKITDLEKLQGVKLILPGLTQSLGLSGSEGLNGEIVLSGGIPLGELPQEAKDKIPMGMVFAKSAGELIDFNMELSVSQAGEPQSKITAISGHTLSLLVKPEGEANSVKGYLIFKSKEVSLESSNKNYLPALLVKPALAEEEQALPISEDSGQEERLVLSEFYYNDSDKDGIYTADIQIPAVSGKYEIITEIDHKDPKLGKKEIKLITVVDPEGYVYKKNGDEETRLSNAVVSLFWLNPGAKNYELWPAKKYSQENPQTTDITGRYSFLVPPGEYYLKTEKSGYSLYQGQPFLVVEGNNVHSNIELKSKYWYLKVVDWKIIVMIIFGILLLYNFYRDRKRMG